MSNSWICSHSQDLLYRMTFGLSWGAIALVRLFPHVVWGFHRIAQREIEETSPASSPPALPHFSKGDSHQEGRWEVGARGHHCALLREGYPA